MSILLLLASLFEVNLIFIKYISNEFTLCVLEKRWHSSREQTWTYLFCRLRSLFPKTAIPTVALWSVRTVKRWARTTAPRGSSMSSTANSVLKFEETFWYKHSNEVRSTAVTALYFCNTLTICVTHTQYTHTRGTSRTDVPPRIRPNTFCALQLAIWENELTDHFWAPPSRRSWDVFLSTTTATFDKTALIFLLVVDVKVFTQQLVSPWFLKCNLLPQASVKALNFCWRWK